MPSADSIAVCPIVGSVVSVSEPLGTGQDKTLPIALKQIEVIVKEMGNRGQDLLDQYFAE